MSMKGLSNLEPKPSGSGLVHLYVGDGKGKTTAAIGLAVRFIGKGGRVAVFQFLKGRTTGELEPLQTLGARVQRAKCGQKFYSQMTGEEQRELRESHQACLAEAARLAAGGEAGLIVLDEVVDAVNLGVVELSDLLELLRHRDPGVEVVLTGRNPPSQLVDAVDYHTDFVCRKHPYQTGVAARSGVEF